MKVCHSGFIRRHSDDEVAPHFWQNPRDFGIAGKGPGTRRYVDCYQSCKRTEILSLSKNKLVEIPNLYNTCEVWL
jgi:hypothetical protein